MNRRFHRWLDDHEIVKLFLMVAAVVAPSILLCLVGLFLFFRVATYRRLAFYRRWRHLGDVVGVIEISLSLPRVSAGMSRPRQRCDIGEASARLRLTLTPWRCVATRRERRDRR